MKRVTGTKVMILSSVIFGTLMVAKNLGGTILSEFAYFMIFASFAGIVVGLFVHD